MNAAVDIHMANALSTFPTVYLLDPLDVRLLRYLRKYENGSTGAQVIAATPEWAPNVIYVALFELEEAQLIDRVPGGRRWGITNDGLAALARRGRSK